MDHIWDSFLEGKSDEEKLKMLKTLREGMTWGTQEHGIPQLSKTVVFCLKIIRELENK